MKLTVYLDMLIIMNILINYFLLRISAALAKITAETKRFILSAIVGSLFSVTIFFKTGIYLSFAIRIFSLLLCSYIAFGYISLNRYIKNTVYLGMTNAMFTGIIYCFFQNSDYVYINNLFFYININPILMVVSISAVYLFLSVFELFFKVRERGELFDFMICFRDTPVSFTAFYDTGFNVKDIIGNKAVMLCSFEDSKSKLPYNTRNEIELFFKGGEDRASGITPIFYSDISSQGMLPAVRPEKVIYKSRELKNVLIAFTPKKLSGDAEMIFGKEIYNMIGE